METDVNSCTRTGMSKQRMMNTKKIVAHPKTRVMVMDAVAELNRKGGVCLKAIKKYIRKVHEVDVEKKGHSIQKAITKALANGELVQTRGSGPNGKFKLPLTAKDVVKPSHSKSILTAETKNDRTEKEGTELQYECDFCDSSFSSVDLRTEHTKEVHSDVHEFPCKYCGQLFLSEINLSTHLVIHSESAEEKPFKCQVCNGGFSKKKRLRKHFQLFHGEKANNNEILTAETKNDRAEKEGTEFQYECGFCDSSFSSVDLRTEHTKEVHSDVQEFPCKYCGQLFLSKITLCTHLVIHSESAEEKPFKCQVCNGGFSKKKQLRKHFKLIHEEKGNNNEEDEPIPELRLMIIGALEFLTYPIMHLGVSYELINRNVQEAFNVKTDCLNVLKGLVRDGIVSLSGDGTYSKNSLHLYWSNQEIKVGPGDLGKVRKKLGKGNGERNTKRRRSVADKDDTESKRLWMDVNVSSNEDSPKHHLSHEEIIFARSVVGRDRIPAFNQFSGFLFTEEGKMCLEVLRREGVNLTNMSSILNGAGPNASKAFKYLYDIWFKRGKKTRYLETLENEGIKLSKMSSILSKAAANAAEAFKELYDLWFDERGKKTKYLRTLEKEEISLSNMSSILSGAGSNAAIAFKALYVLWFDEQARKTQYLDTLKDNGVSLAQMSCILNGSGAKAPQAFKDLYDLWFNRKGKKTRYLKSLKREGINLCSVSSILAKARYNAAIAFKDLYDLWFDEQGNRTQYLNNLKDNGVSLARMSGILSGAGAKAPYAFKELYDRWFNRKGKKKQYLKTLKREGIDLSTVSSILNGAGANAAKSFKDLYDLWFDEDGKKTTFKNT